MALQHGYRFTILKCLSFEGDRIRPFNDYMQLGFDIKKRAGERGDPVGRALGKLLCNAVYGKMLEKRKEKKVEYITNLVAYDKFLRNNTVTDYVKSGKNLILYGEAKNGEALIRKPSYLGAFVTSFSRMIISERMFDVADPTRASLGRSMLYGDTDSAFLPSSAIIEMGKHDFLGEEMGCANNDIGGDIKTITETSCGNNAIIIELVAIAKKVYLARYLKPDGKMDFHKRAKGLPAENITYEDYMKLLYGEHIHTERQSMKKYVQVRPFEERMGRSAFEIYSDVIRRRAGVRKNVDRWIVPHEEGGNIMTLPWGHKDVPIEEAEEYIERFYGKQ